MRVIPNKLAPARLSNSIEMDLPRVAPVEDTPDSSFALSRSGFLLGNGRAIFIGLFIGALVFGGGGYLFKAHLARQAETVTQPLLPVATDTVTGAHPASTPEPIQVDISADALRVTAISLGHPRLAVINGRQAAEGDFVTVRSGTGPAIAKLRVVRIGDGVIELTDGKQTITTRLNIPSQKVLAP